jgi:hypothetical protein
MKSVKTSQKLVLSITYLLYFILLEACSQTAIKGYDLFEENERDKIVSQKVTKVSVIQIGLDTAGTSLWKRLYNEKYYNKFGLIYMSVSPKYEKLSWPTTPTGGLTQAQIDYYLRMNETNIPTGTTDTTFYFYDKNYNLIKRKNQFIASFKYDRNNNLVETCTTLDYGEIVCNYIMYEYDEVGRIISKTDSAGAMSSMGARPRKSFSKKGVFKYDGLGRVVFDGAYDRVFNERNQLIEVMKKFEGSDVPSEKFEFFYDEYGNRVKEIYTRIVSSSWNPNTNAVSNIVTQQSHKHYYYDQKGLLIQEKVLDERSVLRSLLNYEYEFY